MLVGRLAYALRCSAEYLERAEPDSLGHIFCTLECPGCEEKNFCLSVKRLVEEELNRRKADQEALRK